jgi:hypothetical protein
LSVFVWDHRIPTCFGSKILSFHKGERSWGLGSVLKFTGGIDEDDDLEEWKLLKSEKGSKNKLIRNPSPNLYMNHFQGR